MRCESTDLKQLCLLHCSENHFITKDFRERTSHTMDELKVETVELGISSSRLERSVTPEKVSISRSAENIVNGSHQAKNGVVRKSSLHVSVKTWQRLEVGVLCVVIVIAWGLLCLPIIFYHVPPVSLVVLQSRHLCFRHFIFL